MHSLRFEVVAEWIIGINLGLKEQNFQGHPKTDV